MGVIWLFFCVNNFDNSNAGAFRQFIIRWMGWLGLWIFIRPFLVRVEGFRFEVFPPGILWYKCFAVVYCLSYLILS
jgi:hypothetical protein